MMANQWKAKQGTMVYVQGKGTYQLKRDIRLSYEIVEPLQQFPREVLSAAFSIRGAKFYATKPTRLFLAQEEWPKKPNNIIAVHEEDLYYMSTTWKCPKCGTSLEVKGGGTLKLVCPKCGAEVTLLLENKE